MAPFARFTEILLGDEGMQGILEAIREDIDVSVAWKGPSSSTALCSGDELFCERASTWPLQELTRIYASWSVSVAGRVMGCLLADVPAERRDEADEKIEDGISAIRLFYGQTLAQDRLKSEWRNDLVHDLLHNRIVHMEELVNRAKTFRWDLDSGTVCLIVAADSGERSAMPTALPDAFWELARSRVRASFPRSIFSQEGRSLVFLLPVSPQTKGFRQFDMMLSEMLEPLCSDLSSRWSVRALAAVGGWRSSPLSSHASYQEARQTLAILRSHMRHRSVASWNELGGLRLIASLADSGPGKEFCETTLGPLLDEKNVELLKTLSCIEESNGDMRSVAQKMSLHYNTVKYRIAKIWDLLGIDPRDADGRFCLSLALRIYKIVETDEPQDPTPRARSRT